MLQDGDIGKMIGIGHAVGGKQAYLTDSQVVVVGVHGLAEAFGILSGQGVGIAEIEFLDAGALNELLSPGTDGILGQLLRHDGISFIPVRWKDCSRSPGSWGYKSEDELFSGQRVFFSMVESEGHMLFELTQLRMLLKPFF